MKRLTELRVREVEIVRELVGSEREATMHHVQRLNMILFLAIYKIQTPPPQKQKKDKAIQFLR